MSKNKNTDAVEQEVLPHEKQQEERQAVSPSGFEFNGERYRFSPDAPNSIRVDGMVYTQQEIAENEELLLQLIAGGSCLIEKIN